MVILIGLLNQGLTFFLSYAILAAVLGMLQFGYNTGVINAPQGVSCMPAGPLDIYIMNERGFIATHLGINSLSNRISKTL